MDAINSQRLKQIELDILDKVDEICHILNIEYFLMGGTLLGAVRHHGFIPWDDDIDIIMKREDYDIFIRKAQSLLPDYYFLQNNDTDKDYLNYFSKIRDSRTTFWESSCKSHDINHGVFIDVFPLDYYPVSNAFLFKRIKTFADMRISGWYNVEQPKTGIGKSMVKLLGKIILPTKRSAIKFRNIHYKSVKSSTLVANLSGAWGAKEIFPKEYFDETIKIPFEGKKYSIPAKFDLILRQMYGDYMQLPPENKRISHHYTEVIDLEKSFMEYRTKYLL